MSQPSRDNHEPRWPRGAKTHYVEQIIPSFLENKIDSLTYCMYLYTCKNTAVHSFSQREEKQPGPFSRLDGKVSHSPFLAGCYMSQWHFCFLSRPGTGFYFLNLEKHLPVLGTSCCKYFPLETFVLPEKALSESPNPHSNQGSPSLIYVSSNWAILSYDEAIQ